MENQKLTKAKYSEWQMSLWGACFIAFGLGALLSGYLPSWLVLAAIVIGIIMHGIGMSKIHRRNI